MQTNLRPENVQLFYFVILKIESFQCELPSVNYVKQKKRTVLQDSSCVLPRFRVHDRVFFVRTRPTQVELFQNDSEFSGK